MFDLTIIGGGPAGVAAGVYAARKCLKTLFVTESWGGQSVESVGIENWTGTVKVSGNDFAKMLEEHLRAYAASVVDIKSPAKVERVEKTGEIFTLKLSSGESFESRAVLITAGSTRRKLDVPGAKEYENKGIVYCASCDGPLFSGQDVAVVGGGNAAFESAAQLLAYSKSVTLIIRSDQFRADPATIARVLAHPNMKVLKNADLKEIKGGDFVTTVVYTDKITNETKDLPVTGVFVEIGLLPSTMLAEGLVEKNQIGQIKVDPRNQRSSTPGVWAAGDCTDGLFHQNNIAAGDAVKAIEDIYLELRAK